MRSSAPSHPHCGADPGPPQLVDSFFRHQYGRLVARLCKKYGARHLEDVEDAVQQALERALWTWARNGVPESAEAWLRRVAENALIDHLRRARRLTGEDAAEATPLLASPALSDQVYESEVADAELRMLFVCCDERFSAQTRLVLCLKLLCGFSVREIAERLFLEEANAQKIFQRGRARLKEWSHPEHDLLGAPASDLGGRVASVQRAIYLQFTEGHSSHREESPVRADICLEALRLAEVLATQPVGDQPASWALLSLLHFQFARLPARVAGGELVLLEDQDRSLWDAKHIRAGLDCLYRAGQADSFSVYHGEAAVLAEHCLAPSYAETRWNEIVDLYELLERIAPSPLYTLNRAIALAECAGPDAALTLISQAKPPAWLAGYYLWDATIGEMHRRAGRTTQAREFLQRAIAAAPSGPQRRVLERRLKASQAPPR